MKATFKVAYAPVATALKGAAKYRDAASRYVMALLGIGAAGYVAWLASKESLEFFVQQCVNGLTLGSVYALIALGYTMVYGILKLLNFAHGEIYMIGAFAGYGVMTAFGGPFDLSIHAVLLVFLMVLAGIACSSVVGVTVERVAYRPLRTAPRIAPLISALGVSFFLQNSVLLLFGGDFRSYDTFEWIDFSIGIHAGPLDISAVRLLVIGSAVVLMILLTVVVKRTRLGKAMRATAFDREAASMMGVDVDRTIVLTFLIASALAGVAGVMVGLVFSRVWHLMGFIAGLKGFTAAVVGGIGSIPGAMLGGILIGLAEAFAGGYISSKFQDLIVFSILIVFLLVRPYGILGSPEVKKV